MAALNHALLGASVVSLAFAGLRLASTLVERGIGRAIAAAAFATAAAVAQAMLLGLLALGGNPIALTAAALATGAAALVLLPRPAVSPADEVVEWWSARSLRERAVLGGVVGAGLAWAAWQLLHPALGFDTIHYHLPEIVVFVQDGHPGSAHDLLPGHFVGNYPLTTEVTIAWAMGIARSFVPLVLWPWFTLALTATSAFAGLRALGTTTTTAAIAAAAFCTNPWLLGWQSNGSVTDPPALAWLTACAALVALSRTKPALLAPALLAGGLAVGGKTTVLPYALVVLALGVWLHARRRQLSVKPLVAALALATLVGGFWYLRNLFDHGSPFWPQVAAPWGDPVPPVIDLQSASFLDFPGHTLDTLHDAYVKRFGGSLVLLAGGLLAPLAATRLRVVLGAAATLVGLLVWARSPITGVDPATQLLETVFSTTRYALPVVAAGCLALALAATDARRRLLRLAPLGVLITGAVVNLVITFRLHFPVVPTAWIPLAGALVGAAAGALVRPRRLRFPALAAVALITLLAIPATGFVRRHAENAGVAAPVVERLANDPAFRDGDSPVATTPAYIGPLAGDRLAHDLEAIPSDETCRDIAARAPREWLVIYGGPFGGPAPARLTRCLPAPVFDNRAIKLYRPEDG